MPLHPAALSFLREIEKSDAPGWSEMPPAESREIFNGFNELFGKGPELEQVQDLEPAAGPPMRLYSAQGNSSTPQPGLLYFHGGGWVLGNLDTHDALCRRLAQATGRRVLSVDYSLSPEHRYPRAVKDGYAALQYVYSHAEELGVDPAKIAVGGDSAGGNLAAAMTIHSRDSEGPAIESQILIYPVVEPDFCTDSYEQFATGHMLTRETMQWFWQQYLGSLAEDQIAAATLAALQRSELRGLPPALVLTAEFDVLRSEGEEFARRLASAGNQVELQQYDGMLHGFVHFSGLFEDGLKAIEAIGKFLAR